jgi:tetratricopeptide (TPR) repeat protein
MRGRERFLVVLILVLGAPITTLACLWDYDTLKQERARFPAALELITGKFLRHSPEFYAWRIQDRLAKLKSDPTNLAYHDDLAVAYQKTGQQELAIKTILAKEQFRPGLYETYSNLGTFHILAGDFEKGLPYIDQALAINPDAHFGRERYQKWLVEYALTRCKDGKLTFPLQPVRDDGPLWGPNPYGFSAFLKERLRKSHLDQDDVQAAVKGVLGMMRFANHANPLLLEALGELLLAHGGPDAKRLAARAYLKASYEMTDDAARQAYRKLAGNALSMQTTGPYNSDQLMLSDLETDFQAELADADQWYAELRAQELGWIRDGKDADAEFDRLYTEEPTALGGTLRSQIRAMFDHNLILWASCAVALLIGLMILRRMRRRTDSLQPETGRV